MGASRFVPADRLVRVLLPFFLAIVLVLVGAGNALLNSGAPGWGAAAPLPRPVADEQLVMNLAMSPGGTGFVVWAQRVAGGYRLYAAQFLPDMGWTYGVPIDAWAASALRASSLAVDPRGDAIVVWTVDVGPYTIWANRFIAGQGWGGPTPLSTDDWNDTWSIATAMDDAGNGLALWSRYGLDPNTGSTVGNLFSARLDAAAGWGPVVAAGEGWVSGLTLWPDGSAVATAATTGGGSSLAIQRSPSGAWSAPVVLNANATGTGSGSPVLCSVGEGRALAAWNQLASGAYTVWSSSYDAASGWSEAVPLPSLSGSGTIAALACNGRGDQLAVWVDSNFGSRNLVASWWVSATAWSPPVPIGTPAATDAQWPVAALDPTGNATVAWWETGSNHAFAARFGRGTLAAPSFQLDSGGGGVGPLVSVDDRGNVVLAWDEGSGLSTYIWTSRYFVPGSGLAHIPVLWVAGFYAAAVATFLYTAWWWRRALRAERRPLAVPPGESY